MHALVAEGLTLVAEGLTLVAEGAVGSRDPVYEALSY
jgi:hypothetical protein